jgi:hypothetical protein
MTQRIEVRQSRLDARQQQGVSDVEWYHRSRLAVA